MNGGIKDDEVSKAGGIMHLQITKFKKSKFLSSYSHIAPNQKFDHCLIKMVLISKFDLTRYMILP